MEKISGRKIVGQISEQDRKEFLSNDLHFTGEEYREILSREKTPEDIELIGIANTAATLTLLQFGISTQTISESLVHMINPKDWPEYAKDCAAFYFQPTASVYVRDLPDKVYTVRKLIHEILHAKSIQILQVPSNETESIGSYRNGFEINDRNNTVTYFTPLNEAIIDILTTRAIKSVADMSIFDHDTKKQEQYRDYLHSQGFHIPEYILNVQQHTPILQKITGLFGLKTYRII